MPWHTQQASLSRTLLRVMTLDLVTSKHKELTEPSKENPSQQKEDAISSGEVSTAQYSPMFALPVAKCVSRDCKTCSLYAVRRPPPPAAKADYRSRSLSAAYRYPCKARRLGKHFN